MQRYRISLFCLLTPLLLALTPPCMGQTPAFAVNLPFPIPLADSTIGQAIILPTLDGQAYLVYATPSGKIGLWTMKQGMNPLPPGPIVVPPIVIPPLDPPEPPAKVLETVVTVSETAAEILPQPVADRLATVKAKYFAFTVAMVAEPSPPENALKWIGRSAGKQHPYTFAAAADGEILWQGPTPKTATDFLAMLESITKKPQAPTENRSCGSNGKGCSDAFRRQLIRGR